MRILPLTTIVLLVGAGYALAQGTPNSTMSSGRPSAVLATHNAKRYGRRRCQAATRWLRLTPRLTS